MSTYIYDKDCCKVIRETTETYELGPNEASVVDPVVAEGTDLGGILIYDGKQLRNATEKDIAAVRATRTKRARQKMADNAKKWIGHTLEGILFTKALKKVLYNQLIRVRDGQPVQTTEVIKSQLLEEIANWEDFDDEMLDHKNVKFKESDANSETIENVKNKAKDHQSLNPRTSAALATHATCRVLYDQIKRHEDGLSVEDIDTVFGANFETVIDNWVNSEEIH